MKYIKVAGTKRVTMSNNKSNMNKFIYGKPVRKSSR